MRRRSVSTITAVIAVSAMLLGVSATPAYALRDTIVASDGGFADISGASSAASAGASVTLANQSVAEDGTMPDNPDADLPETVSENIPDDAVFVSPDLVTLPSGTVKDAATGKTVTDPTLVGTEDVPADPLAKTDGQSFVPVSVDEVKESMAAADSADSADDDANASNSNASSANANATVRLASFDGNEYGAYWGTYNGSKAFFEADGTMFVQQAKGVIDVSAWQNEIDWEAAKADGVEGAIIRIGYGAGNPIDAQAIRNVSECKRLGIPFGVYLYSYSDTVQVAEKEGEDTIRLLREAGIEPDDLSYPVYYDLERWTWTGHTPPTDPDVYDEIVNMWWSKLTEAGYSDLAVYSYTSYLYGPLNSENIHSKTQWVASYGQRTSFEYSTNYRGWQYTSGGAIDGIEGRVDMNAFGYNVAPIDDSGDGTTVYIHRLYNKNDGLHHYTSNAGEASMLVEIGWRYEGVSFDASRTGKPVYRVYNPNDGCHHYTLDASERDHLVAVGWQDEGIGWYIPANGSLPVYRLYNPNTGEHVFTTSYGEYEAVGAQGWVMEGIAWQGLN